MNENNYVDHLLKEGTFHLERSHYDEALEIFQQADELNPDDPKLKNALGLTYFRQGQYQKSIEYLNLALQLKPDYLSALVRRGMAYKYSGQTELGNADYEAVLQAEPQTYEDWRAKGVAYDELKQAEAALKCYKKALEIKNDDYQSWNNIGWIYYNENQLEFALKCFEKTLNIFSERFFTIRDRAYTLFVLQRYKESLDGYKRAIELKPDDYISYTYKGVIFANLKHYSEAIISIEKSLEINPNWQKALTKKVYIQKIAESTEPDRNLNSFLLEILLNINSGCQQEQIHSLFKRKISLFKLLSSKFLQTCTDNIVTVLKPKSKESVANDILLFGLYVSQFTKGDEVKKNEIYITSCEIWAVINGDLGTTYLAREAGDKSDNIEAAISYYYAALKVFTETSYPEAWAKILSLLACSYIERIEGNRKENLETAINCCNAALEAFTEEDYLYERALIFQTASVAYLFRIEGERKENLEIAINCCNAALEVFTKIDNPNDWSMTLLNAGAAYLFRIKGERKENLEIAINCCNAVLEVFTKIDNPKEYGMALLNAGSAYIDRIEGDRKENLEIAINCCNAALEAFTTKNNPKEYGMALLSAGSAYIDRIEGDRKENLETAFSFSALALEVFTELNYLKEQAMVKLNMSSVFLKRIAGKKSDNIKNAINYCNEALKVFTKVDYKKEWGLVNLNLGAALLSQFNNNEDENLDNAINCLNKALEVITKKDFPEDWAMIHLNLGSALISKQNLNREKNIEDGIAILKAALSIYSKEYLPHDWAMIQFNLGIAYIERLAGDRTENFEKAIKHYQEALTIETPQTNPFQCIIIAENLGSLAFKRGDWELAIEAYSTAIKAIENNRLISTNDVRRQEIISNSFFTYTRMVQSLINNEQITQAIEYVERSRCRRLVDLMATNDLYNDGNIPSKIAEYLKEYEAIQKDINAEVNRITGNTSNNGNTKGVSIIDFSQSLTRATYDAANNEIRRLEVEKEKIWKKIRTYDRVLSEQIQVIPVSFDNICQLISDSKTAIIYFWITINKLQIFIVSQEKSAKLLTVKTDLKNLVDFTFNSWIIPYLSDFEAWNKQLPQNLAILAEKLNLSKLVRDYLQDIEELIIVPHLYLNLVPFAALPISPSENLDKTDFSHKASENDSLKLLGDRFRVRTLPSAQILQFCHQRDSKAIPTVDYGIVEDADNSLPCSQYEGEQIAQIFDVPEANRLRGETQATVAKYRELVGRVQVLHSSHHAKSRLDNPLKSYLKLADGTISLGEIMSPGWRLPNLEDIFLSCCETNFGNTELNLSDDPLTLATGFLCAGAKSVVSTLWEVDDLATSIFSIIYYQLRKEGLDRPTALQQAQYKLRTMSGEELEQEYGLTLGRYLEDKFSEAVENRQKTTRNQKYWRSVAKNYRKSRKYLEQFTKKTRPFAHPYYWAGFISQGLR